MPTALRVLAGAVLVAHGAVHLLFLLRADGDPRYPFGVHRLAGLRPSARRPVGAALAGVVVVAATALGLAVWGVSWLGPAWPVLAVLTAAASLLLVALVRDRRLALGAVINLGLLVLAAVRPDGVVP